MILPFEFFSLCNLFASIVDIYLLFTIILPFSFGKQKLQGTYNRIIIPALRSIIPISMTRIHVFWSAISDFG